MATWKHLALELFPEDSSQIETGDTIDLSLLLERKLVDSLQHADYTGANTIVRYVLWLVRHSRREWHFLDLAMDIMRGAIGRDPVRSELWKAMSETEFETLLPVFSGILNRDASKELEREFIFAIR